METCFCWTLRYVVLLCATGLLSTKTSKPPYGHWHSPQMIHGWAGKSLQMKGHVRLVPCFVSSQVWVGTWYPRWTNCGAKCPDGQLGRFSPHDFKDSYYITLWHAPSSEGCCLVLLYPRICDIQGTPIKKNNHGAQEGPGTNLHLIWVDLVTCRITWSWHVVHKDLQQSCPCTNPSNPKGTAQRLERTLDPRICRAKLLVGRSGAALPQCQAV